MNEIVFTRAFDLKLEKPSTSPLLIIGVILLILIIAGFIYAQRTNEEQLDGP